MTSSKTALWLAAQGRRGTQRLMLGLWDVQEYTLLSWRALRSLFSQPRYEHEILAQMDSLGVGSLGIVILTGLFTGMVLALQSAASLDAFGMRQMVGRLVCISMVKELGPVLTALMVTGRVGSGMAAELGSMVVTQQIDALRVLGTDPVRKLVAPRILAGMLMVPVLTIISDSVGVVGGALISVFSLKVSWEYYWRSVGATLALNDIWMGLAKPIVFGFLLASVGCYTGLATKGGTQGVGLSTTRSVVAGSVLILLFDLLITKSLLLILPGVR